MGQGKSEFSKGPILCLDFDGVVHSYTSGWKGASIIPDPPVEGAMRFLVEAVNHFTVAIFSSRSNQWGGLASMKKYVRDHLVEYCGSDRTLADDVYAALRWPKTKPAAFVTLDDRALTFDGTWPTIEKLQAFKPWHVGKD